MNPQEIDNLSNEEIGKLFPIVLSKPKSNWKQLFEEEKKELYKLLNNCITRIEHIGSTAIPNILSKPTIDILVEIPNYEKTKDEIIQQMMSKGYYYTHRTDRNPPYIMFIKGVSVNGPVSQTYHIHMAEKNHPIWDKVYFRDYLIEKPELAKEYERLKEQLANEYRHNRDGYTAGKTEFVLRITREAKEKNA